MLKYPDEYWKTNVFTNEGVKMKIENLGLNAIKPYEKNPRKNDAAVDGVAESIKQFGFLQPVVVDKYGVIVAGHTRYKAAKKLGLESVPCVRVESLTEEQVKAYRILDNKLNENAVWDFEALSRELKSFEFNFNGFDVELPPFEQKNIEHKNYDDDEKFTLYPEYEDEDSYETERYIDLNDSMNDDVHNTDQSGIETINNGQTNEAIKNGQIDRVIIIYNAEQEEYICKMLGVEKVSKLVYRFEELAK